MEESLSDGTFVRFVRADILYSEIIKDKLQDLTDGKFFRTPLKKATQATAREENRANLEDALRKTCGCINLNGKKYQELVSISHSIDQLQNWMI